MTQETTTTGPAKPEELDYDLARRAYNNISWSAEKRAKEDQNNYADDVNSFYAEMAKNYNNPAQLEYLNQAIQEYKTNWLSKYGSYLNALSGVASAMITGPANFPTARNQKRSTTADNRMQEFHDWEEKARRIIVVKLTSLRDNDQIINTEWKVIGFEINRSLQAISDIDAGVSHWSRSAFVSSINGIVKTQAKKGKVEIVKKALALVDNYNENHDKDVFGPKHKFWLMVELAQESAG